MKLLESGMRGTGPVKIFETGPLLSASEIEAWLAREYAKRATIQRQTLYWAIAAAVAGFIAVFFK